MTADSKGRDLFIVDNSVSGWTGLRYLEEWSGDQWSVTVACPRRCGSRVMFLGAASVVDALHRRTGFQPARCQALHSQNSYCSKN